MQSCRHMCCMCSGISTKVCAQCDAVLCEKCDKSIHSLKVYATHIRKSVNSANTSQLLYCLACSVVCCDACRASEHVEHSIETISNAAKHVRNVLFAEYSEVNKQCEHSRQTIESVDLKLKQAAEESLNIIDVKVNDFKMEIDRKGDELRRDVSEIVLRQQIKINHTRGILQDAESKLAVAASAMQQSDIELLIESKNLLKDFSFLEELQLQTSQISQINDIPINYDSLLSFQPNNQNNPSVINNNNNNYKNEQIVLEEELMTPPDVTDVRLSSNNAGEFIVEVISDYDDQAFFQFEFAIVSNGNEQSIPDTAFHLLIKTSKNKMTFKIKDQGLKTGQFIIARVASQRLNSNLRSPWKLSNIVSIMRQTVFNLKYEHDFDINGVLYFLGTFGYTKEYDNPYLTKQINVKWSSVGTGRIEYFSSHEFPDDLSYTRNEPNSWMMLDLGEKYRLYPSYYTLRHGYLAPGAYILRNWRLEACKSISQDNWTTLSEHVDDESISGQVASTASWPIENFEFKRYRYFRVIATGPDSSGENFLNCSGIELYGLLEEKNA